MSRNICANGFGQGNVGKKKRKKRKGEKMTDR